MTRKQQKRRSWRSLTILSLTLLAGCSQPAPLASSVTYCPAAIHPDAGTRAWLNERPMPPATLHYFNQIANQQALFDKGCK